MLTDTLTILGYIPEDDSWDTDGRRTYSIDDDASRAYLTTLAKILKRQGWDRYLSSHQRAMAGLKRVMALRAAE